jgi:hypothetical protein
MRGCDGIRGPHKVLIKSVRTLYCSDGRVSFFNLFSVAFDRIVIKQFSWTDPLRKNQ